MEVRWQKEGRHRKRTPEHQRRPAGQLILEKFRLCPSSPAPPFQVQEMKARLLGLERNCGALDTSRLSEK